MKYLYLFSFILLLVSCKKDPIQYKFEGIIVDKNTNTPIKNVLIKISQKKINSAALNPNFIDVTEITTDNQGKYSINFEREKILDIKFELDHPDFYATNKIVSSSELSTQNINEFNFKIESKAWIKVRLINSFVVSGEQLNFFKHNVKENCIDCCANDYTIAYDTNPDTTFICPVIGDRHFKYSYGEVLALTSVTDSIYCTKNDTTELLITY